MGTVIFLLGMIPLFLGIYLPVFLEKPLRFRLIFASLSCLLIILFGAFIVMAFAFSTRGLILTLVAFWIEGIVVGIALWIVKVRCR